MSEQIALFCELHVHPALVADFDPIIRKHAETCLREEEGCQTFIIGVDVESSTRYMIFELYRDKAAVDLHNGTDRFYALQDKIQPMLSSVTVITAGKLSGNR